MIHLGEIWDQITANAPPDSKHDFLNEFFGPMFQNEETSGDEQYAELESDLAKEPGEIVNYALIHAMLISCAYAVQAMKAANRGDDALHSPDAWRYAAEARYWEGIVVATWAMKDSEADPLVEMAKKGADARHTKNREYKAMAIAAYQQGNFRSKDEAAEKIAGKIVPLTFRAVRDYLKGL